MCFVFVNYKLQIYIFFLIYRGFYTSPFSMPGGLWTSLFSIPGVFSTSLFLKSGGSKAFPFSASVVS